MAIPEMWQPLVFVTLFAGSLLLSDGSYGLTLDDIKGYSIEVKATRTEIYRSDPSATYDIHERIYIGVDGDVFTDLSISNASGRVVYNPLLVAHLGKANFFKTDPRVTAWDFEGGHLTAIVREVEGFFVRTFTVDSSRTSCTYALSIQLDPTTGRYIVPRFQPGGKTIEIVSYTIGAYTCIVKQGNIFANSQ